MIFNTAGRSLSVVLTTANTTVDMPVNVSWKDTLNGNEQSGSLSTTTNGTTAVTLVSAATDGWKRELTDLTIYNQDTASKVVRVSIINGATTSQLTDITLQTDDVLGYAAGRGWYVLDANGNLKTTTSTIGGILSTSPSAGIGYATGSGAAVTQLTNRSTGVTINAVNGAITTNNTSLAAGASAVFTVTNSAVAIGDVVLVAIRSGSTNAAGVAGTTSVAVVAVAAGSFNVAVDNQSTTTAETGAIVINFCILRAVSA